MSKCVLITVFVLFCVAVCLPCALAEVLIDDTFDNQSAVVGNNLTTLGWTNVMGQIVVSSNVIDAGKSAINNVGGWSVYSKDFSSRALANGETAVLIWSGKVGSTSVSNCQAMYIAAGGFEFQYYFYTGGFRGKVVKVVPPDTGNYWVNDFETETLSAMWKIELKNNSSKFYYNEGFGWILTMDTPYGAPTAGVINLVNAGSSWTDNISYEIVSP